jgi:hypothetical protein
LNNVREVREARRAGCPGSISGAVARRAQDNSKKVEVLVSRILS